MMIDTTILSYAFKGIGRSVAGTRISSVVANEFLEMYDHSSNNSFRYYILYRPGHPGTKLGEHLPTYKPRAIDQLIFDFGKDYATLIEYGSRSIATMINDRAIWSFNVATHRLEKSLRKKVRRRFSFICENDLDCVALTSESANVGIDLLAKFTLEHSIKKSLRNSVNDMMILATALCCREDLFTSDTLLSRFAANAVGAKFAECANGSIHINFSARPPRTATQSTESKGYINRGWRIAEEARRAPWQ